MNLKSMYTRSRQAVDSVFIQKCLERKVGECWLGEGNEAVLRQDPFLHKEFKAL